MVDSTPPFLVGAAEIDITPVAGTHLSGDACRFRPVEKVLHPLFARALVASSGTNASAKEQLCLTVCSLRKGRDRATQTAAPAQKNTA